MAHTPTRSFRCPDHLWKATKDLAESEGKTITELLTGWMTEYVETKHELHAVPLVDVLSGWFEPDDDPVED